MREPARVSPAVAGLGLTLASAILLSWLGVATQLAFHAGASLGTLLAGRFLVAAAILWPLVWISGRCSPPAGRCWPDSCSAWDTASTRGCSRRPWRGSKRAWSTCCSSPTRAGVAAPRPAGRALERTAHDRAGDRDGRHRARPHRRPWHHRAARGGACAQLGRRIRGVHPVLGRPTRANRPVPPDRARHQRCGAHPHGGRRRPGRRLVSHRRHRARVHRRRRAGRRGRNGHLRRRHRQARAVARERRLGGPARVDTRARPPRVRRSTRPGTAARRRPRRRRRRDPRGPWTAHQARLAAPDGATDARSSGRRHGRSRRQEPDSPGRAGGRVLRDRARPRERAARRPTHRRSRTRGTSGSSCPVRRGRTTASVLAATDVRVRVISQTEFASAMQRLPTLARSVQAAAVAR